MASLCSSFQSKSRKRDLHQSGLYPLLYLPQKTTPSAIVKCPIAVSASRHKFLKTSLDLVPASPSVYTSTKGQWLAFAVCAIPRFKGWVELWMEILGAGGGEV